MIIFDPTNQRTYESSEGTFRPTQCDTRMTITRSLVSIVEVYLPKGSRVVETQPPIDTVETIGTQCQLFLHNLTTPWSYTA